MALAPASFFNIPIDVYVEDIRGSEPIATRHSAFSTAKAICARAGQRPPAQTLDFLGAHIDIRRDSADACLPAKELASLAGDPDGSLARGLLIPGDAAKIRAQLGFSHPLMFREVGRAHLAAFTDAQYTENKGTKFPLGADLRDALKWRSERSERPLPRRVCFPQHHPVLVYSDASGFGHICATIYHRGAQYRGATHLPDWFANDEEKISEYEPAGAIIGLAFVIKMRRGARISLRCDNQVPNGTVVRGSNRTRLGRARCFHVLEYRCG